jgi:CelD/BcsL family acetyltransferase involved in cellulose biosynthesis
MQLSISSDFQVIEHEWRGFEKRADCTPFQTFDWLSAWQRCIGTPTEVRPAIVIGRQSNGELLFVLPLAIERARFSRRCVFLGHTLCDYNAPLLAPEFPCLVAQRDFVTWWHTIETFIRNTRRYHYDVRLFDKMPERIGRQANPMLALATMPNPNRAYRATLGKDWDSFYASKRSSATRSRDRNKLRRLAEHGELRLTTLDDAQERQSALRIIISQKSRSFAHKGVANVFEKKGHYDFYLSLAATTDWLIHISRLDVGSTCVAANLGLRFRDCYYYIVSSYDDGPLVRLGPGVIHLHELIRYAISQGLKCLDLTIGDHPYKRDWADEEVTLYDHHSAVGWLGLPAVAELMLKPRAMRLLKKAQLLWQFARRCKSVIRSPGSSTEGRLSA